MARLVAGTLLLPTGQPMAGARIYFVAKRTEAASIVEGANASFATSASGAYSQNIVNGYYAVSIEVPGDLSGSNPRRYALGDAVVETGAATTIEALLIASNPPADLPVNLLMQIAANAQQSAASAQASASAAAASAASISVGTGSTQLPNNTILNARLGTAGNLGTLAQQNSSGVTVGELSAAAGIYAPVFQPALSTGTANLDRGLRWSSEFYNYGVGVSAASGGLEFHANEAGLGDFRWYAGSAGSPQWNMGLRHSGELLVRSGFKPGNVANTDGQVLDWYEEGGFTPTVVGSSVAGTANYSLRSGRYQRIGNRVNGQINVVYSGHTGLGQPIVEGLPFVASSFASNSIPTCYHSIPLGGVSRCLQGFISPGGTVVNFDVVDSSTGGLSSVALPASANLLITFSYEV